MTYPLDGTGLAPSNAVTNEVIVVKTIGKSEPQVHFLANELFYAKNFVATYTDVSGATRTLTYGTDYLFIFKMESLLTTQSTPLFDWKTSHSTARLHLTTKQ
jgi:hypothetical protein